PDPGRLAVAVHDHHVGDVDRRLLGDDATGLGAALAGTDAGVLLDPVDALDEDLVQARVGRDDLALGAPVLAGDDDHRVALLDLHGLQRPRGKRDDLHKPLVPQLPPDRAEDAGTPRVAAVLDDDRGVLVEPDVRAV